MDLLTLRKGGSGDGGSSEGNGETSHGERLRWQSRGGGGGGSTSKGAGQESQGWHKAEPTSLEALRRILMVRMEKHRRR